MTDSSSWRRSVVSLLVYSLLGFCCRRGWCSSSETAAWTTTTSPRNRPRRKHQWKGRRESSSPYYVLASSCSQQFTGTVGPSRKHHRSLTFMGPTQPLASSSSVAEQHGEEDGDVADADDNSMNVFDDFVEFLIKRQDDIIGQLEDLESSFGSDATFGNDPWGIFEQDEDGGSAGQRDVLHKSGSGGRTRVLQGGTVVEKGACSLTLIRNGVLTADRASTIRARNNGSGSDVQAGDAYAAAALSMVLHSKSPMVPTFRSDVRIFVVERRRRSAESNSDHGDDEAIDDDRDERGKRLSLAWFGGGADLTPYVLFEDDIRGFHETYRDLCSKCLPESSPFTYKSMKKSCDEYFYLPARQEHRGTGGIFFDDMESSKTSLAFVKNVVDAWMPSWIPIVKKRQPLSYTETQKQWQLLRRGRYLEFNLLYDRGALPCVSPH